MAPKTAPRKRRVPVVDKDGRTKAQRVRDMVEDMCSRPPPHRWSKKAICWALDVTGTSTLWRWVTQAKRDDDPVFDATCSRDKVKTDQPLGVYVLLLEVLYSRLPPDVTRQRTVIKRAAARKESFETYLRNRYGDDYIPPDKRKRA